MYAKVPKPELETVALAGPLPGASDLPPCEALPGVGEVCLSDVSTTQLPTCDDDNDDKDNDDNDDDDETVVVSVRQSLGRYPRTMYVGLYKNHLFYIQNRNTFAKSYRCSPCGELWTTAWHQQCHERGCNQQVR